MAPRLLAHVHSPQEHLSDDLFDADFTIAPGSWLDGRELREAIAASDKQFAPVSLLRGNRSLTRLPSLVLRAGDRVVLRDTAVRLKELEGLLKAPLHDPKESEAILAQAQSRTDAAASDGESKEKGKVLPTAVVAQLIITPGSPLVGRSVRQERMAPRFDIIVVGLRRANQSSMSERQWVRQL